MGSFACQASGCAALRPQERAASDGLHCCLYEAFQGSPLKGDAPLDFTKSRARYTRGLLTRTQGSRALSALCDALRGCRITYRVRCQSYANSQMLARGLPSRSDTASATICIGRASQKWTVWVQW